MFSRPHLCEQLFPLVKRNTSTETSSLTDTICGQQWRWNQNKTLNLTLITYRQTRVATFSGKAYDWKLHFRPVPGQSNLDFYVDVHLIKYYFIKGIDGIMVFWRSCLSDHACLRQPTLPLSLRINTGSLYRNVSILNYKRDQDNVS